jgi:hypothetical protein
MTRTTVYPALMMLFLVWVPVTWAKNQAPKTVDEPPEMEMLEFLGSFEDKDTGWIDPFELESQDKGKEMSEEERDGK